MYLEPPKTVCSDVKTRQWRDLSRLARLTWMKSRGFLCGNLSMYWRTFQWYIIHNFSSYVVDSAYWRKIFLASIMSTCSSCRDLLAVSICRKAARRIRMINESATSSDCFGYILVHTNEGFALENIIIWNPENCHGMAFSTLTTPNM